MESRLFPCCLRQSGAFLFNPKNRSKQNVLIWLNFFFQKQIVSVLAYTILEQSKAIWFGPEIVSGKAERFYLIRKLINWSKMFGFNNFFSKADRFRFGPKILGWSKIIFFGLEIVSGKGERFYLIPKLEGRNKTFWFKIFFSKADRFRFGPKIRGWSKTIWFGPEMSQENLFNPKTYGSKPNIFDFCQKLSQLNRPFTK